MQAIKKASSRKLAKKNDLQFESYRKRPNQSSEKNLIGEILFICLQDPQRLGAWQKFERLLRLRWSDPPISAVKMSATTTIPQHTQAGLRPRQARTPDMSHKGKKINPDEGKAFSRCEISAGVNL